jgi:hypothetical protein
MNLDFNGLPVQSNGDALDQLNRCGLIVCASLINNKGDDLALDCSKAIRHLLQISPGVYVRCIGSNANNVSADQLIPLYCYKALGGPIKIKHLFFAQNTHDFDPNKPGWKFPDFMLFRALPLWCRSNSFSWLRYLADVYLYVLVLGDYVYLKTDKEPYYINCTMLTLLTCNDVKPTLLSLSAWKLWRYLRPNTFLYLRLYHRAESGGNPEIADMYAEFLQ